MIFKRFFSGFGYFFQGAQLLVKKPKMIKYTIMPMIISTIILTLLLIFGFNYLYNEFSAFLPQLKSDTWYWVIGRYIWFLVIIVVMFLSFGYLFLSVAKILAAPFNDLLSEKIELMMNPNYSEPENAFLHLAKTLFPTIVEELKKITLILSGYAGLLFLNMIPMMQIISAPLLVIYSMLVIAIDFSDYTFSRHQLTLKQKIMFIKRYQIEMLGFGAAAYVFLFIPFINLLVIQIAVISSTILVVDKESLPQ